MTRDRRRDSTRIVIVEPEEATRASIKNHLALPEYEIVGETHDVEAAGRLLSEWQPDLVLMTLPEDATATLDSVRRTRETLPRTGIVLMAREASPQLILASMRAGAHEFLTQPLNFGELDEALARLQVLWGEKTTVPSSGGRVFATYPAKGGVGASSLAANLALALRSRTNEKVVLVDFNLQVGDLALMLDMSPRHSFAHAIGDGEFDAVKLRSMISQHPSGLSLLAMADRPEESNLVRRNHVASLLRLLREMYEHVVVDLGRHIDERTIELLDHSDVILLVTQLDVPTIRNTRSYLDLFRRLEIPPARVRLIVNRLQDGRRVTNRDLVRSVGREIYFGIPNDYAATSAAIDSGSPVVLNAPRTKLANSYRELAQKLASSTPAPSVHPVEQGAERPV